MAFIQKLSDRYLYLLVHVKGLVTHGFWKRSYAQFGEDVVLATLLPERSGFFVDVGAFHPFHYSNTYLLYRRGWRGLNIDPNPWTRPLFRFHRPRDTSVTFGIGGVRGRMTYYQFNHQACNTFSKAQRDKMLTRSFVREVGESEVFVAPLSELIDQYGRAPDFLNIDVEGMNLEVLRTLDWERHAPRVLCVEDDEFDFHTSPFSKIHDFVESKGYLLSARMGPSSVYVRKVSVV